MKQRKIVVFLTVAMIAGCHGQSPAPPTQSQGAVEVAQARANVDEPINPVSTAAEEHETSPDAGLFRSSFDECVTRAEGVTPDTQACIESEFEFHDARLQAAYQKQRQSLKDEALQAAKRAQEAWLAGREKECAWDARHEGQGQRLDANYCNLRSTAMRANELETALTNQN